MLTAGLFWQGALGSFVLQKCHFRGAAASRVRPPGGAGASRVAEPVPSASAVAREVPRTPRRQAKKRCAVPTIAHEPDAHIPCATSALRSALTPVRVLLVFADGSVRYVRWTSGLEVAAHAMGLGWV